MEVAKAVMAAVWLIWIGALLAECNLFKTGFLSWREWLRYHNRGRK